MKTLKRSAQMLLGRVGLHDRLRASCIYDAYWRIADRRLLDNRGKEVEFYRNLLNGLRGRDLIFDVGANHGYKTDIFLRLGARVVAVEPDDHNQAVLRDKFLKYRLSPKPVTIVGKAVSDKVGIETMWIDAPGSALNTLSKKWADTLKSDKKRFEHTSNALEFAQEKKAETTTLEQLTVTYGRPFFIKIDVEGYELVALRGMRRPVPYLSFEVNLPEFRKEGLQCVDVLEDLAAGGQFNCSADCRCGLTLERWVDRQQFSQVLDRCTDKSIEVFWRTHRPRADD